jgi:uncharacterized protein
VKVGISIDGPGPLNDARWNKTLSKTRASTARTEEAIGKLCAAGIVPSLIVTLHRLNADEGRIGILLEWFTGLQRQGIRQVGLHLLEVESPEVRERYGLSDIEAINAISAIRLFRKQLRTLKLSLLDDIDGLLRGRDSGARCIWRACDQYTTPAVTGVDGQGERSRCSRVNKEGIDFLPAPQAHFERYLALYQTPQEYGGCKDCRFFLMCRGQCPGTALDGDWRNRSEQCNIWKAMFELLEGEMLSSGETPLSRSEARGALELDLMTSWERGYNATTEALIAARKRRLDTENQR